MDTTVDHSKATVIFVLGLLGVITCPLMGPFALLMGNKYKAECAEAGEPMEGMGTAGWVMGIVGTVLLVVQVVSLLALCFVYCICGGGYVAMLGAFFAAAPPPGY